MRIYQKLIIVFFVLGSLIAFVSYISFSKAQKALQEQIGKEALLLSDQIMMEIDKEIYHRIDEMQVFAMDISLVNEASFSNEEFDKIPNVQDYIKTIDSDWKDNKDTQTIRSILNNNLSRKLKKHLEFYKQIYGSDVFGEMYVTNKYGVAIASTVRLSDYLQADDDWYPQAVAVKGFWVDDLEYDESSDTFSIGIVSNLYDEEGRFAGIFKGALNVEYIKYAMDLIHSRSQYKSVKSFLVDKNGLIIFSGLDQSQKQEGRDFRLEEFGTDISLREPVVQVIKGNNGYILNTEAGTELLSVFSRSNGFSGFKGLGWSLILDFETAEVFSPVLKIKKGLSLVFMVTMIIASFIGIYVFRSISRPLAKLRIASIEIGKGKLDTRAEIKSKDEIGLLADTFNKMAEDIQKRELSLQESRKRFSLAVEGASVGLWEWNIITGEEWWSDRFRELIGCKSDELPATYESWKSLLHPDDVGKTLEAIKLHLETGEIYNFEYRLRNNNGDYRWFLARGIAAKDEEGHPIRMSGSIQDITERKLAEERLITSERKSRAWLENSPACTKMVDLDFNLQYMSSAGIKGLKIDDVTTLYGKPYPFDFYPESFRNVTTKNLEKVKETGEIITQEASVVDIEGNELWFHSTLVPVNDDEGRIDYIVVVSIDTTERQQAEQTLKESEEKYRSLFEAAEDAILITKATEEGKPVIVDCNEHTLDIFGCSREEIIGKSVEDFSPSVQPDGRLSKEVISKTVKEVLDGNPQFFEFTRCRLDGSFFQTETTINRLEVEKEIYMQTIIRDITERKKAEEALQESEKKYRTLFERSADAVLIIEGNNFVDCNSATVKMLGYKSKKELLNTHPSQLSPPVQPDGQDSFEKANQMMAMAFDKGSYRFEWDHQRKNGEVFPVEVLLTSIPFKEGNSLHVVWRDITERKQAESELENHRKHLEALVKERTQELENAQEELVRKERLAALGELIATVSHEIRNPLGTIRNSVYSIGEAIDKNKMNLVRRALKLAESNITRCNRIINELLDYTRKREIKLERTEIDSWLNGVLDEQEFPEDIECVRKLHSGIVLQIDREYMRRVIFNVITNAVQALQEEDSMGNLITVESVKIGERLELHFIDTGPGIPDEIREKIFEPLFSTKSFGVGLGVPIIKNLMDEHQGDVKFQSEVDKGTIVTLVLPLPKLEKKR